MDNERERLLPEPVETAEPKGPYLWSRAIPALKSPRLWIALVVVLIGGYYALRPIPKDKFKAPADQANMGRSVGMGPKEDEHAADIRARTTFTNNTAVERTDLRTTCASGVNCVHGNKTYDYNQMNRDNNAIQDEQTDASHNSSTAAAATRTDPRRELELQNAMANNIVTFKTVSAVAAPAPASPAAPAADAKKETPKDPLAFDPHRQDLRPLYETQVIPAVLDSRLVGEMTGPVDAHVTRNVYEYGTKTILIPQGARLAGTASKVSNNQQARLAITFQRILVLGDPANPNSPTYSIPLEPALPALDSQGSAGVGGKVNNHTLSLLLAAGAVGIIQGAGYSVYSGGNYGPSVAIMSGATQSTSEISARILDRYLNRLPSIVVPEGTRINVELAKDMKVPPVSEGDGL